MTTLNCDTGISENAARLALIYLGVLKAVAS